MGRGHKGQVSLGGGGRGARGGGGGGWSLSASLTRCALPCSITILREL